MPRCQEFAVTLSGRRYLEGSSGYRRTCSIHLNQTLPPSFSRAFRELILSTLPSSDPEAPPPDPARSQVIFTNLANIGLLSDHEHLMGTTLKEFTTNYVKENCARVWDRQVWNEMKDWFTQTIQPWIEVAYTRTWMKTDGMSVPMRSSYSRMVHTDPGTTSVFSCRQSSCCRDRLSSISLAYVRSPRSTTVSQQYILVPQVG